MKYWKCYAITRIRLLRLALSGSGTSQRNFRWHPQKPQTYLIDIFQQRMLSISIINMFLLILLLLLLLL